MNSFTFIKIALLASVVSLLTSGCQKQGSLSAASSASLHGQKAATSDRPLINGPQVAFYYLPVNLGLTIPADQTYVSATWNFGDGSAEVESLTTVSHDFAIGSYEVTVTLVDTDSDIHILKHAMNVLDVYDGFECLVDSAIVSPAVGYVNESLPVAINIPSCFLSRVTSVDLSFGNGTSVSEISGIVTYAAAGDYTITARIFAPQNPSGPFLTLTRLITIIPRVEVPTNPLACLVLGETRSSFGSNFDETQACGVDGSKVVTSRLKTVEECKTVGNEQLFVEISKAPEVVSEGECLGQSCTLPDGSPLADGQSRTLYSSQNPAGTCDSVSSVRTCSNGVLSGSESAIYSSCNNGCGDFGAHGTVKTGIVVGETQVALICSFGEQGFFDLFHRIEDQTCNSGSVISSNSRQGDIKSKGLCPVYSWEATDSFTACSADCGGSQDRIFVCKDNSGVVSDDTRCLSAKPVESKVCDGNPEAVRRSESSVIEEDGSSSATCPKNQIGIVVKTREVTTTKIYACINHAVGLESQSTVNGPWVSENHCRDYVARRCSQDSLNNTQARGRYQWMEKCAPTVPVIADFLETFKDVVANGLSIDEGTRRLYATFMNRTTNPEKPWIAPTTVSASCDVPASVYVASVCVSSCATPEQQILTDIKLEKKMKYVPFIDALVANTQNVATLSKESSMNSHKLERTQVEQWITELMDTDHVILEFRMKSGRSLRLTPNHPVLAQDGSMKLAESFKAGDHLVQLGGKLDEIKSITSINYHGKVYNVFVKSSEPLKNVVVTNGYLNGTAFYQNEGAVHLNRQLLKKKLTRGIFGN